MLSKLNLSKVTKVVGFMIGLAAVGTAAEAQRFGGYFYTGQQTINLSNQSRVCKVYGYDFAKFNPSTSKIVDVQMSKDRACASNAAKWNGDCCKVSYTNTAADQQRQRTAPTRQRQLAPTQQRRRGQ